MKTRFTFICLFLLTAELLPAGEIPRNAQGLPVIQNTKIRDPFRLKKTGNSNIQLSPLLKLKAVIIKKIPGAGYDRLAVIELNGKNTLFLKENEFRNISGTGNSQELKILKINKSSVVIQLTGVINRRITLQ